MGWRYVWRSHTDLGRIGATSTEEKRADQWFENLLGVEGQAVLGDGTKQMGVQARIFVLEEIQGESIGFRSPGSVSAEEREGKRTVEQVGERGESQGRRRKSQQEKSGRQL